MLVVVEHRPFAEAMALAVDAEPGFRALGTPSSATEAMRHLEMGPPDVALVDLVLGDVDGVGLTAQIKKRSPSTRVVVITGHGHSRRLASAAEAGVDDFVSKSAPLADVFAALANPDGHLPARPGDLSRVIVEAGPAWRGSEAAEASDAKPQPLELTARERQVLSLLAQGRPAKSIARELKISINTCRAHIRALLDKLGVHSQLSAIVRAARLGLLPVEARWSGSSPELADPGDTLSQLDLVDRLFAIGLSLVSAQSIVGDGPTSDRIAAATDEVDRLIHDTPMAMFGLVTDRPALQERIVQTARALQRRALDTVALLEGQASRAPLAARLDYPTEIKRWRAFADQAEQMARRWEQPR